MTLRFHRTSWIWAAVLLASLAPAFAQPGMVQCHQKLSDTEGGFTGTLDDAD